MATVPTSRGGRKRSMGECVPHQNQRSERVGRAVVSVGGSAGVPSGVDEPSKGLGEVWATGVPACGVVVQGRRPTPSPRPALSTGVTGGAMLPGMDAFVERPTPAVVASPGGAVRFGPLPVRSARRPAVVERRGLGGMDLPDSGTAFFYLVPATSPAARIPADREPVEPRRVPEGDRSDTPSQPHVLLTIQEVAATLRCGRTCVYDLIGHGELPALKLGRLTRIPAAAVEAFVSRRLEDRAGLVDPAVARWAAALPRRVGVAR